MNLAAPRLVALLRALRVACNEGAIDRAELLREASALLVACGFGPVLVAWEDPREHTTWEAQEAIQRRIEELEHPAARRTA